MIRSRSKMARSLVAGIALLAAGAAPAWAAKVTLENPFNVEIQVAMDGKPAGVIPPKGSTVLSVAQGDRLFQFRGLVNGKIVATHEILLAAEKDDHVLRAAVGLDAKAALAAAHNNELQMVTRDQGFRVQWNRPDCLYWEDMPLEDGVPVKVLSPTLSSCRQPTVDVEINGRVGRLPLQEIKTADGMRLKIRQGITDRDQ